MTTDEQQSEHMEIYKLHAELADRVSQRREGANRLYVSLHVVLVMFLAALIRFGVGDAPERLVISSVGVFGILLSISWFSVIRSYRQLNTEKFRVLHELEKKLSYPFFTLEWDPLAKGEKSNRYWKLTNVEVGLPIIFSLLFAGLILYSFLA